MNEMIRINKADNVGIVIGELLKKGECFDGIVALTDIPRGHKMALSDIPEGSRVIKYCFPIGHASAPIRKGEWVHSHNLSTSLGDDLKYEYHPKAKAPAPAEKDCPLIEGYVRKDGSLGIRNELWIIPTVGCVNGKARAIAESLLREGPYQNVDDICAFTHNYGCSQLGEDHENTRHALAALARHPNAGGVLVLGLGCENNQISLLREGIGDFDQSRVRFITAQEVEDEVAEGICICKELLAMMANDSRTPAPLSKLKVGLKCGGSDGLSGITANPLVGRFSDWLVGCGGTTVLTEVPEMFGAETILMDRATDENILHDIVCLINGFKDYFCSYGQPIYENPSPGNKAGGITTLEEKSLGCVQKGGTMPVAGVVGYAERLETSGLNLLRAPGNDLVAATALALAGCQIVLFTTGRGTPFGTCVPTVKISTNTDLSKRKPAWIDFNAGGIACGDDPARVLEELKRKVLAVANGEKTRNEESHAKEIAIFKSGVTL